MIKYLCHLMAKTEGWSVINQIPKDIHKAVIIGYPHTSNWDFKTSMFFIHDQKIKARFAIKQDWIRFPIKTILTSMGAIGVNRDKDSKLSTTDILANLFSDKEELLLMISPEGTRSLKTEWKSGFYYVAKKANVPIILLKADHKKKIITVGEVILYPENYEEDMATIMTYYKDVPAKNPMNASIDLRFDK